MCGTQVNPHTHQLKLCDFGSAKVLVRIRSRGREAVVWGARVVV